jgi:hypothetical protein
MKGFKLGDGDGANAVKGLAKLIAVIVILAVSAFGDVMYIIEIQKLFADKGILLVFCYVGGVAGFLSVCYLLIGKAAVFRPGGQMLASWMAFGAELIVISLNIMYVFTGATTGPLAAWGFLSPATPAIHMLLIAIVYYLDPELKVKHKKMELQAKIELAQDEYTYAIEMAKLKVMETQLGHLVEGLSAASNSGTTVEAMQAQADRINEQLLTEMGGRPTRVIDSGKPKDGPKNPYEKGYGNR